MLRRKLPAVMLIGAMLFTSACGALSEVNLDGSDGEGGDAAETTETELPPVDLSTYEMAPIEDVYYNGDPVTVPIEITIDGRTLAEGTDYTVYYENNVNVGTATVTVVGNDTSALGSTSTTFRIITGDEVCDAEENAGLLQFVYRIYVQLIGRNPSLSELTDNVIRLRSGSRSGIEAVNILLQSPEYAAQDISDSDAINLFYLGVLNREADGPGLTNNLALLAEGMTRSQLFNSIMSAPGGEFDVMCQSLGITLGVGSVAGAAPVINDGIPSSSFNYSVDGRNVTIHRRIFQFITASEEGPSVFDLDSMCSASGFEQISADGSFVYGTGVYELTVSGNTMSMKVSGDEVSYFEDTVEDGEELYSINGTDTTVTLGMIVMIEYSLESIAAEN